MNCITALRLFSAERDGALHGDQRGQLESHVATCRRCRQARAAITLSIADWRASAGQANPPNTERVWQAIRSHVRNETPPQKTTLSMRGAGWVLPAGAVIALALAAAAIPRWQNQLRAAAVVHRPATAHADFVEVPNNASSIVYVDDQSGWLVVWSDTPPAGG